MKSFLLAVVAIAAPLHAQTTGVFDMGQLTGTVAMGAVSQAEERRAGGDRSRKAAAIKPATKARLQGLCRQMRGRGDAGTGLPEYQRYDAMCQSYGF